jgi:hypothetical protein
MRLQSNAPNPHFLHVHLGCCHRAGIKRFMCRGCTLSMMPSNDRKALNEWKKLTL